ncbi:hypothetical protein, partial [Mycolicibacterium thermoresistibile]
PTGVGMANSLEVDTDGLRRAAAASSAVASSLIGEGVGGTTAPQPSGAGVAAMNATLTSLQNRQSMRITGQADGLSVSGAVYERTDTDGSDAIKTVSV